MVETEPTAALAGGGPIAQSRQNGFEAAGLGDPVGY